MIDSAAKAWLQMQQMNDKSFHESDSPLSMLFGGTKYNKREMRETWDMGIEHGFELGLEYSSQHGQKLQLHASVENDHQKEFYKKFLKLCVEYKLAISYDTGVGMHFEPLTKEHIY